MGRQARRRTGVLAVLSLAALVIAGCGGSSDGTTSAGENSARPSLDTAKVVIAWNSTPDESYLPLLMAVDAMKKRGFDIEAKQLSGSDISFQSLASDQIQFTADSLPPGALSISQGAPVRVVGTRNANLVVWVARPEYADCAKLQGKPVGIYSETGGYTVLMKLYFEKHCPGVKPKYIAIPDSPLRAQAVGAGRIGGTALGLPDAVALQKQSAGANLTVVPLREDLPGVGDEYVYSNDQTIKDHPTIVQALLTEQLKAIRSIYATPDSVEALVKKYLPAASDASVAHQFVTQHIWYANGGLKGPGLANTLEAFDLPGEPAAIESEEPLAAVIKDIGPSQATQY